MDSPTLGIFNSILMEASRQLLVARGQWLVVGNVLVGMRASVGRPLVNRSSLGERTLHERLLFSFVNGLGAGRRTGRFRSAEIA